MKKLSLFMLAAGSLAMLACARPVKRQYDDINRRRRTETDAGIPRTLGEQDMQAVAQESSMVAPPAQQHTPNSAAPSQPATADAAARKDGDFAPPVGA